MPLVEWYTDINVMPSAENFFISKTAALTSFWIEFIGNQQVDRIDYTDLAILFNSFI